MHEWSYDHSDFKVKIQSGITMKMFNGGSLNALKQEKSILPGDVIHAARILGKCNKRIFNCHVFLLFWDQFLETHRI